MAVRLAWRSLWRNRRRTFITLSAIAAGLALVIFFITMGDGIYYQLIDDAAKMQAGHITIEHKEYRVAPAVDLWVEDASRLAAAAEKIDRVESAKKLVMGQGVARSGAGNVGVGVMGVQPEIEKQYSQIARHVIEGEYLAPGDDALVVVGVKLAEKLELEIGKKIVLTANDADGVLVEQLLRVKGIFESGSVEIDGYFIQTSFEFARQFFGLPEDAATQVGVVVSDPLYVDSTLRKVETMEGVGDASVRILPWFDVMPDLASYIRLDKISNIIMQCMLMFLIFFTIFNTILMSVLERQREFASLQALGTPPSLLRRQVVAESVFIGLLGAAAGVALGWAVSYYTARTGLDISQMMAESSNISGFAIDPVIRPKITAEVLMWSGGAVVFLTTLLSGLTVLRINDSNIAEMLRHE